MLQHGWSDSIMLSERSQKQKVMYCVTAFIWNIQNSQIIEIENRLVGSSDWGEKKIGSDC